MSLTSSLYFVFLCASVGLFHLAGPRPIFRRVLLLASNVLFYASLDLRFLPVLAVATGVYYVGGVAIDRAPSQQERKARLVAVLAVSLGLLGVFKYAGIVVESLGAAVSRNPDSSSWLFFPVGVSFYTFHGVGYLVDVFRRDEEATTDPILFASTITFFPHLLCGPLTRYRVLRDQMHDVLGASASDTRFGLLLLSTGALKKNMANFVSADTTALSTPANLDGAFETWGVLLTKAGQLYLDFSGYTDMAMGAALLFGIKIQRNFDLPFLASSPGNLWKRWHISLSTWLQQYLFIPLARQANVYLALLLTWTLAGVWHGAGINYAIYGVYHGLAITGSHYLAAFLPDSLTERRLWRILRVLATFYYFCISVAIFTIPKPWAILRCVRNLHGLGPGSWSGDRMWLTSWSSLTYSAVFWTAMFCMVSHLVEYLLREKADLFRRDLGAFSLAFSCLVAAFFLPEARNESFVYFEF